MKALCAGLIFLLILSGCATTGLRTAHSNSTKVGEAWSKNILGMYASGDASIEAAKKNGNITTVSSVDTKIFAVRPFYGSVCTIVRTSTRLTHACV